MTRRTLARHATRAARWGLGLLILLSLLVAGGLACLGWIHVDECRAPRLIALMYHRFVSADEYAQLRGAERIYSMPVERFREQLQWLRDAGHTPVTLAQAVAFARGEIELPQPAVLITIDDGCRSVHTRAEPLLRQHGFRATLFVTTDPAAYVFDAHRPDQSRLSDAEIGRLDPAVFDVAAHGVTHRPLRDLSDAALAAELRDSRAAVERLTGRPCRAMAVPGNWYSERVLRFARQAGYEAVFTSDAGAIQPGDDAQRLSRINVAGYSTLGRFASSLTPFGIAKRRFTSATRRLVGPVLWTPLESVIGVIVPADVWVFYAIATGAVVSPVLWFLWWRRRRTIRAISSSAI